MKTDVFHYFHSDLLDQDFAIHKQNRTTHFQDGTKYTEAETLFLAGKTDQEKINLHNLKKKFSGTIKSDSEIALEPEFNNTEQESLEL